MTETHTPEPAAKLRPDPTHVVEVYLQDNQTLASAGRTEKYFYGSWASAEATYETLAGHVDSVAKRENDVPEAIEVADLFGRGTLIARDLRGVRFVAISEFDEWALERDARIAGVIAGAKHAATVG